MQTFTNSNQLKAFMKKEANRLGISINNAYSTYISRLFLERLSKTNDGMVLVKGSSAETAYLGKLVRGITDVDLAVLEPIGEVAPVLGNALRQDENSSNFQFRLVREPKITPTGIYKMSLSAEFDKTKQPLGVDVQENYDRLIEREVRTMPAIFEGDEEFKVLAPSFEEYLAEKLCIIVESNKPDVLNTRAKDFYDIYQLHGGKYSPEKLTKYFGQMLALRGKIRLEDATTMHLNQRFIRDHQAVWESTKKKYDFLYDDIDLYGAVYYARAVIREELHKNGAELPPQAAPKQHYKKYRL